jgi:hypothetical protein
VRGGREYWVEAVAWPGSGRTVEGMQLRCGACVSTTGEREDRSGKRRNSEEKA